MRLVLRRQFSHLVKGTKESMAAWIGRVKGFAYRLDDIEVSVSDEDCILALTNGLDDSYDRFVILLDITAADQLTLAQVLDRLLNEEMRCTNKYATEVDQTALLANVLEPVKLLVFGRYT